MMPRKASTLVYFAASFVAAAMLSAVSPAATLPALSVTMLSARPMAAAGSDATTNQGVALTSTLRNDEPVYTTANWVKAVNACTKLAARCEKPEPRIGALRNVRACVKCKSTCIFAAFLVDALARPTHELKHWGSMARQCSVTLEKLVEGLK